MKKVTIILMSLTSVFLLDGCASLPKSSDMVPQTINVTHRSSKPVRIVVEGQLMLEDKAQVPNQTFAEALQMSIAKAQIFTKVDKDISDGFLLEVFIVGYEPPKGGFNMAATLITRWKLTRLPSQEVVFEDFVKKTHTNTVGDAFVGATRWRMANEGVVKDTIAEGIMNLSKLDL